MRVSTPSFFLILGLLLTAPGCPKKKQQPTAADAGSRLAAAPAGRPDAWPKPTSQPRSGGTLTVRLRTEPPHLNLLVQPDHALSRVTLHQIFETLLWIDPKSYRLAPALARSWKLSKDRRTVTLRLRRGVRWHDGRPFTSADVKFTLDTVLDPHSAATALRGGLRALGSVEVGGPDLITLRWRTPYYHALHSLTGIPILPRHIYGHGDLARHPANRAPVGTGPFRFRAWKPGREIVLGRWTGYWGRRAHLETLRYRVVREHAVAAALIRRGELDVDERAGNDQWLEAARDARLRARALRLLLYPPGFAFRVYNTRRPPLSDRRVRLALTLLDDRATAIREVHRGLHRPASGHYAPESPCHDPARTPHPFDPKRARQLLAQAGYGPRRPLRLTWLIPSTSRTLLPQARIFQADARRAGVQIALETTDWATFISRLRGGRFEMAALAWFHGVENDPFFLFHSSQATGGLNYGGYRNPELDDLLERSRREFEPKSRLALCRRIERILHVEQPYTFLYQLAAPLFVSKRLDGVYPSLLGLQYRDFWLKR